MSHFIGAWDTLTGRGHNSLTLGTPSSNDAVLYQERVRKKNIFLGRATHTFSYACKPGEEITAILAYDEWTDNTGGEAQKTDGGVGQRHVTVRITAQFNRGFHFTFVVFGKHYQLAIGQFYIMTACT